MAPSTPQRRASHRNMYDLPLTRTPKKTPLSSARPSMASPAFDRYIPNRTSMNVALIGSSLRTAETRRMELTPKVYERQRSLTLGRLPDQRTSLNSPPSSPLETADQAAFRQTMGAVLHSRPLEDFHDNRDDSSTVEDVRCPATTTGSLLSIIHPNLKSDYQRAQERSDIMSYLAYSSVSNLEDEVTENTPGFAPSRKENSGPKRLLDFGGAGMEPRSVRPRVDPFAHNHHEVIQRAATNNNKESFRGEKVASKFSKRKIPDKPTKVLDAPDIVDDYYLNLISWSKDNILAVAMGPSVYVWNAANGDISHVVTLRGVNDYVSSVSWSSIPGCTRYLAVGTHSNTIQLWDTEAKRCVRKLHGHTNRVSAMTWNTNKKWLTSGGRDSQILQHDVRCSDHIVAKYKGHRQEVCGLKWNDDGLQLASGGNENYLCIWDAAISQRNSSRRRALQNVSDATQPRLLLTQHKAAVKALDWCPFNRGLLASGGGSADRTIKFWNTMSGSLTQSIDTGSQVCSLIWSKHQRELCSSHGFSENQLILWKYPSMTKVQEFKSHTARVLNMEMSPDGRSVVSVGADETLRFWDIFGPPPQSRRRENFMLGDFQCPGVQTIR
jgi:cell division cycle protein 20 (cofactor of APC complex)